ncbi:hypothetical protein LTR53_017213 [Teratosphaeriaceae sp. CCFEE 6253]|nr:hypothetical protein LTR53_017213 [Teratosphaeriaceae sp. CCFEE 6253]
MKLSTLYSYFVASTFSTLGSAMILLDPLPSTITVGETHELTWTTDQTYLFDEFLLVLKGEGYVAWSDEATIFKNLQFAAGTNSYNWTVPNVKDGDGLHAIWLNGMNVPDNGAGYANISTWFTIEGTMPMKHAWPAGKIVGAVLGLAVVLCLAAAAHVLMVRARRRRAARRVAAQMGSERGSLDPYKDAKDEVKVAVREIDA